MAHDCPECGETCDCGDLYACDHCPIYDATDAAYDRADEEFHDLRDNGLI